MAMYADARMEAMTAEYWASALYLLDSLNPPEKQEYLEPPPPARVSKVVGHRGKVDVLVNRESNRVHLWHPDGSGRRAKAGVDRDLQIEDEEVDQLSFETGMTAGNFRSYQRRMLTKDQRPESEQVKPVWQPPAGASPWFTQRMRFIREVEARFDEQQSNDSATVPAVRGRGKDRKKSA
jgi:hypothetical protein